MPYIERHRRDAIKLPYIQDDGDLAYVIDRLMEEHLWSLCGYDWTKLSFSDLARVQGIAYCAIQEFYRRVTAEHEDRKRELNGDVFAAPHAIDLLRLADEEAAG